MGSQILVVGRYHGGGVATVTLKGEVDGQQKIFRFPEQDFPVGWSDLPFNSAALASIPRLWATRKIGYLLNQTRLNGPDQETIDQIVRLSIRYGVVTPYTSYLVTEKMPLGAAEQDRIAVEAYEQLESMPTAQTFGRAAVEKAAEQGALAEAEAPAIPDEEVADVVRIVGARTYVLSESVWIDTAYDPGTTPTVKIPFLSADYFAVARAHPAIAAGFALGERVIALQNGVAYEVVVQDGASIAPTTSPTTLPESPTPELFTLPETIAPTPPEDPTLGDPSSRLFACPGGFIPLALSMALIVIVARRRRSGG